MKNAIELEQQIFPDLENPLAPSSNPPVKPPMISIGEIEKAKFTKGLWGQTVGAWFGAQEKGIASTPQLLGNTIRLLGENVVKPNESGIYEPSMWSKFDKKYFDGNLPDAEEFNKFMHERLTSWGESMAKAGEELTEMNQNWVDEQYGTPDTQLEKVIGDISSGVQSAATAVLLTAVGGSPLVLTGFGVAEGTSKYAELRDHDIGINKAMAWASLSGLIEGSVEAVSTYLLWNSTMPWLARGGMNALLEGGEEVVQTGSSMTISNIAGGQQVPWKEVVGASLYAGAIGFIVGGPMGMGVAIGQRNRISDIYQQQGFDKQNSIRMANEKMAQTTTQMLDGMEQDLFGQMVDEKRVVMDAVTGKPLTVDARKTLDQVYQRYVDAGLIKATEEEMTEFDKTATIIEADNKFDEKRRNPQTADNTPVDASEIVNTTRDFTKGKVYYHVTRSGSVESIQNEGIRSPKEGEETTYKNMFGAELTEKGNVYLFDNYEDAVRWAGKMEFDLGGEQISIVGLRSAEDVQPDTNIQMQLQTNKGKSVKLKGSIKANRITSITPVTRELIQQVIAGEGLNTPTEDFSNFPRTSDIIALEHMQRQDVQSALRRIKQLATNLGVKIVSIDFVNEDRYADWDNEVDRQSLIQHGVTKEIYDATINEGKVYRIAGEHLTQKDSSGGLKGSKIRLFRGFTSEDVFHEFSHAVEEQGGIPNWAGSKEEHAHFIEQVLQEGKERGITEFTREGRRINDNLDKAPDIAETGQRKELKGSNAEYSLGDNVEVFEGPLLLVDKSKSEGDPQRSVRTESVNKTINEGAKPKNVFQFSKTSPVVKEGPYKGYKETWMYADMMAKKMLSGEVRTVKTKNGDIYFVATGKNSQKIPAMKYSRTYKEGNVKVKAYILDMPAVYTCMNCKSCAGTCYAISSQTQYPAAKLGRFANMFMWMTHRNEFINRTNKELKKSKFKNVRLHASGDIFSQKYLDYLVDTAKAFPEKNFYVYTKIDSLDFSQLEELPNFNKVESILEDGDKNYGNAKYVTTKSKELGVPICPASKQAYELEQENIKRKAQGKTPLEQEESQEYKCADKSQKGNFRKCSACTKNKYMLFYEHGSPMQKAAEEMIDETERKGYWKNLQRSIRSEANNFSNEKDFMESLGNPLYHGTHKDFDKFEATSFGSYGEHSYFYFSDKRNVLDKMIKAGAAKNIAKKKRTISAYLDIHNPLDLTEISGMRLGEWKAYFEEKGIKLAQETIDKMDASPNNRADFHPWKIFRHDNGVIRQALLDAGYDSIKWFEWGGTTTVALKTEQILTKKQLKEIWKNSRVDVRDTNQSENIEEDYDAKGTGKRIKKGSETEGTYRKKVQRFRLWNDEELRMEADKIEKFKNTGDAIKFGLDATPKQIEALRLKREQAQKKVAKIKEIPFEEQTDQQMQDGMTLAVESQFYREAYEAGIGKITKPDLTQKEPPAVPQNFDSAEDYINAIKKEHESKLGKKVVYKIWDINTEFQEFPGGLSAENTVKGMMKAIQEGDHLPPILVSPSGYLQDGRHRLEAYKRLGIENITTITGYPDGATVSFNEDRLKFKWEEANKLRSLRLDNVVFSHTEESFDEGVVEAKTIVNGKLKVLGEIRYFLQQDGDRLDTMAISNIYVDPKFRRKGIATEMYRTLHDLADEKEYLIDWGIVTPEGSALHSSIENDTSGNFWRSIRLDNMQTSELKSLLRYYESVTNEDRYSDDKSFRKDINERIDEIKKRIYDYTTIPKVERSIRKDVAHPSRIYKLVVDNQQKRWSTEQLKGFLAGKVSQNELDTVLTEDFMNQGKVTKDEIIAQVEQTMPKIGVKDVGVKWSEWQMHPRTGKYEAMVYTLDLPATKRKVRVGGNRRYNLEGLGEKSTIEVNFGTRSRFAGEGWGLDFAELPGRIPAKTLDKIHWMQNEKGILWERFYFIPFRVGNRNLIQWLARGYTAEGEEYVWYRKMNPHGPGSYRLYKNKKQINYNDFLPPNFDAIPEVNIESQALPRITYKEVKDVPKLFESGHWPGIMNPISHLRATIRRGYVGDDIYDTYFIEEIQSDWANTHRKRNQTRIPLVEKYIDFTVKQALKRAAESTANYVSWTTGEQQIMRWESVLRTTVDAIEWSKDTKGTYTIEAYKDGQIAETQSGLDYQRLVNIIGKGMADDITNSENNYGQLAGEDLRVDKEWAYNIYDKQIPNAMKKLTGQKPFVVDMSQTPEAMNVSDAEKLKRKELSTQLAIELTPDLRKEILAGTGKIGELFSIRRVSREQKFTDIESRIEEIIQSKAEYKDKVQAMSGVIKNITDELETYRNNIGLSPTGIHMDIFDTLKTTFKNTKKGEITIDQAAKKAGYGEDIDAFVQYLNDMDNALIQAKEEMANLKVRSDRDSNAKVVKTELQYLKEKMTSYKQGKLQGTKELQAIKKHIGTIMRKALPIHQRGKALTILQNVNAKNLGKSLARIENIYQETVLARARQKAIDRILKGYKHPENVLDVRYQEVIENVRKKLGSKKTDQRKALKELSTQELVKLAQTIATLEVKGREIFKNRGEAMNMAREILRAGLIKETGGEIDAGVIGSYEEKEAKKGITRFRLANMRPINLVRTLFGKTGESMLYNVIDYSETIKAAGVFDRVSRIRASFRRHISKDGMLGDTRGQHEMGSTVTIDGVTFQMNDLLSMYAQQNNEKALKAILFGNNMSEETFNKFMDYMDENHPNYLKFADEVKEIVGDRYEDARQTMANVFNMKMPKENDYWPMFRVRIDANDDPEAQFGLDLLSDADMKTVGGVDYVGLEKGFTFGRKDISERNQMPISLDFMGDAIRAIETQEHFINFAKVQKMYNGLISDKAFRLSVTYNHGANAWMEFEDYMKTAINPRTKFKGLDIYSAKLKQIRKALGVGYLGFNVVTALKQFPSAHLALKYTDLPRLYQSMARVLGSVAGDGKLIEELYKLDPTIKNRVVNRDIDEFQKSYPKLAKNSVIRGLQIGQDLVGKKAFDMIMMMDKWAVLSVYDSVYRHQVTKVSKNEARDIAHKAVLETQPQGRMIDLPSIYRTNNEFLRMSLMFTNQLNQIWNMATEQSRQEIKAGEYGKTMVSFASIMISSFMIYLASHGGKWPEDDEEQALAWFDALAGSLVSSIPIIGNMAMAGARGYTPSINPLDSIIDSFKIQAYRWKNEDYAEAAIETLLNVGIMSGEMKLPIAQPRRTIKGVIDLMEGESEDWRRLIWSRSALHEDY